MIYVKELSFLSTITISSGSRWRFKNFPENYISEEVENLIVWRALLCVRLESMSIKNVAKETDNQICQGSFYS